MNMEKSKMEVIYTGDMEKQYMAFQNKDNKNSYSISMVTNNKIKGLLKLEHRRMDDTSWFYYDITRMQSMSSLVEKISVDRKFVYELIKGIIDTLKHGEEYLLSEQDFILHKDFIYIEPESLQVKMCYLPGYQTPIPEGIRDLMEFLMNKVDYSDQKAVVLVYNLYRASKMEQCTFGTLKDILEERQQSEKGDYPVSYQEGWEEIVEDNSEGVQEKQKALEIQRKENKFIESTIEKKNIIDKKKLSYLFLIISVIAMIVLLITIIREYNITRVFPRKSGFLLCCSFLLIGFFIEAEIKNRLQEKKETKGEKQDKKITLNIKEKDEKESENLSEKLEKQQERKKVYQSELEEKEKDEIQEDNKTIILAQTQKRSNIILIAEKTGYEDIIVNDFPFFIGKLQRKVDYYLPDNTVSRFHAKIDQEQEGFFLYDLGSTNGTYLNKRKISPYEKQRLEIGDKITFSTITYRMEIP